MKADTPGLLPVLRAFVSGNRGFRVESLEPPVVERALRIGLGPILAYVTQEGATARSSSRLNEVQGADLAARLLTANLIETSADVLRAAHPSRCSPVVLKGASTALQYYPEPHLRPMGDVDLLVAPAEMAVLESQLRAVGFVQKSLRPATAYERHHHTMPFWHPHRRVWIEVHTRLFPPGTPLDGDRRFSVDAIGGLLSWSVLGTQPCRVMNHELQLVYTASRWSEMLNAERGLFPLLDAALLVNIHAASFDWDRVSDLIGRSWAVTALRLMLGCLDRWELATVPREALRQIAARDPFADRLVVNLLQRLTTTFVLQGRQPGSVLTSRNLRVVWSTLVQPKPPWAKLLALPVNVAFPPDEPGRFDPVRAVGRLQAVLRRSSR